MADIEPYKQIKTTNIQEHNDLVGKINEIIEVINQTNLETITPKISKLEQDVSAINATDALQWNDIETVKTDIGTINPKIAKLEQDITTIKGVDTSQSNDIDSIKAKNNEQDSTLATHANQIDGVRKSLVSSVVLMNGTTTGNMKARIEREDAPSIDSNDYNIQKPTSVELIQGSAPAMVKAQITLSDGTVLVSDDFMFTTEAIGQDVYISSFVFKNGNVAGTISADIGLSNGSTLTANNFAVPTDPNVTSAIADLQTRLTTVENTGITDISALKTTVSEHTTEIDTLKSDVAGLMTDKADVNNSAQTIVAGSINATNIKKNGISVATVNDIPSVPDISGKADLNNTKQTIVAGTIFATNLNGINIKKGNADVATVNDIPNISGKVDKAQGVNNAGKVLGIGSDGNVTPVTVSSGGENWEEVDLSNFPNNWVSGERIKVAFKCYYASSSSSTTIETRTGPTTPLIEFIIPPSFTGMNTILYSSAPDEYLRINNIGGPNEFNGGGMGYVFWLEAYNNSTSSTSVAEVRIDTAKLSTYIYKMYRLKK